MTKRSPIREFFKGDIGTVDYVIAVTFITLLVAILLGVIFYADQFVPNFISDVVATIIGVAIGIPIAVWISGFQEEITRKNQKEKMLILLKGELEQNRGFLSELIGSEKQEAWESANVSIYLKDELWRAFSDGGELQWISDTDLLGRLANAYDGIKSTRSLVAYYTEIGLSRTTAFRLHGTDYLHARIKVVADESRSKIDLALKEIENHL